MKTVFFDIEALPNYFLILFKDADSGKQYHWEMFEDKVIDGTTGVVEAIYNQCYLVGYNSNQFDIPLLLYLAQNKKATNKMLYEKGQALINKRQMQFNNNEKSIDLMSLCFNVTPKSLKLIGCSLKMPKLQDLPLPFDRPVLEEDLPLIRQYCENDVLVTEALYYHKDVQNALEIRKAVEEEYNIKGLLSKSDSSMGNVLYKIWYSQGTGLDPSEFAKTQTNRGVFPFSDALIPEISNSFLTASGKYIVKALSALKLDSNSKKNKKKTELKYPCVKAFGLVLQYGAGGLHSKDLPEEYNATPEMTIRDWDIENMYPAICINYSINPLHLDDCMVKRYKSTRDERLMLKANGQGKTKKANSLKIMLVSYVGKFGSEFSFLRDDLCLLQVSLNGQLLITKLLESLYCTGFKLISVNTDGVVSLVPVGRTALYESIVNDFAKGFNITGEYNTYKRYIRRDVNNYFSLTATGIKVKGIFDDEVYLTKGFRFPVLKTALKKYYVSNGELSVEEIIKGHTDIYDFCIAQKVGRQFKVFYGEEETQHSVRAYVSTKGKEITKHKMVKDKKTGKDKLSVSTLLKNKKFVLFNDYVEEADYQIDYPYYIAECQKIIDKIKKVEI